MEKQVIPQVQEERSKKLLELSNKNQVELNNKYIGKEVDMLFEEDDGKYIKGHTKNYIVVKILNDEVNENLENVIKKVKILKVDNEEVIGEF